MQSDGVLQELQYAGFVDRSEAISKDTQNSKFGKCSKIIFHC